MIARVAIWAPMPEDDRQWVIDAAKAVSGVRDAYHLPDPKIGNGLSVAFFDDDVDVAEVKTAVARKADEIGWHDVPRPAPKSETVYRVVRRSRTCSRSTPRPELGNFVYLSAACPYVWNR